MSIRNGIILKTLLYQCFHSKTLPNPLSHFCPFFGMDELEWDLGWPEYKLVVDVRPPSPTSTIDAGRLVRKRNFIAFMGWTGFVFSPQQIRTREAIEYLESYFSHIRNFGPGWRGLAEFGLPRDCCETYLAVVENPKEGISPKIVATVYNGDDPWWVGDAYVTHWQKAPKLPDGGINVS
jgi:hypothetical protein